MPNSWWCRVFLSELLVLNNWKDCVRKGKREEGCESCNQTLEKIAAPAGLWSFLFIYKRTVVCMKCMKMDFVKSVSQIWGTKLWIKSPPHYYNSWESCETWKCGTVFLLNSLKRRANIASGEISPNTCVFLLLSKASVKHKSLLKYFYYSETAGLTLNSRSLSLKRWAIQTVGGKVKTAFLLFCIKAIWT